MGAAQTHLCDDDNICGETRRERHLQTSQAERAQLRCINTLFDLYGEQDEDFVKDESVAGLLQRIVDVGGKLPEGAKEQLWTSMQSRGARISAADFHLLVTEALSQLNLGPTEGVTVLHTVISLRVEETLNRLSKKLFAVQDLNNDGFLDENELIQLNKKVAMLHYGSQVNKDQVSAKYRELFRSKLDPEGTPVSLERFSQHVRRELESLDSDRLAQLSILEQWLMEAISARLVFRDPSMQSINDLPFLLAGPPQISEWKKGEEDLVSKVETPPLASDYVPRAPVPSEAQEPCSASGAGGGALALTGCDPRETCVRGSRLSSSWSAWKLCRLVNG